MDVLIDNHAVIWFITNDQKSPNKAKIIIEDINNNFHVSIACFGKQLLTALQVDQHFGKYEVNLIWDK